MANPSQGPSGRGSTANRGIGSMYQAFEDYDRQARQRKYMIAEYEDRLENLDKELKEAIAKNKAKEVECEKLQLAAPAAEANYEKKVKEKELMENSYQNLSKEMDEINEEISRKKAQLKKCRLFHEQKVDQITKTEEAYLTEYMQNPKIAKMMEKLERADELDATFKKKLKELERRKREQQELLKKHDEDWEAFKKKCVRLAEIKSELKKKLATLEILKAEHDKISTIIPVRRVQVSQQQLPPPSPIPSSSQKSPGVHPIPVSPRRMEGLGSDYRLPYRRRSSTFQQLDRMVFKSNTVAGPTAERRTLTVSGQAGNKTWKNLCGPMHSGSTLLSQIRSTLKGTVTVHPMPRNQDAQPEGDPTPNHVGKVATINPTQLKPDCLADKTNIPPPQIHQSRQSLEQPMTMIHQQVQDNAKSAAPTEPFKLPPPPSNYQQSIPDNSEKMEVTQDENFQQVSRSDQTSAEQDKVKPVDAPPVSICKLPGSVELAQKSNIVPSQNPSPPSSDPFGGFFCSSKSNGDTGMNFLGGFGFGSTPSSSAGGDTNFFGNFFDPDSSGNKTPEFNFPLF